MSLFKRWYGPREAASPQTPEREFDLEWAAALRRFEIVTGARNLDLRVKQSRSGQPLTPHQAVPELFSQWDEARTEGLGPRRLLLFHQFYSVVHSSLNAWQTANFAIATCRAEHALPLLEQCWPPDPSAPDYAEHCAAFAKTFLSLTRYEEARGWAQRAASHAPEDGHFQTLLADTLHLTGDSDAAHAIYTQRLAGLAPASSEGSGAIQEMFAAIFVRETGRISSPVLAIAMGRSLSNPAQAAVYWPMCEAEFYEYPYFRMQYAYLLAEQGETEESFQKLYRLVREMPWVPEASLNLLRYFEQFDPSGQGIEPEFQAELRQTIRENGWATAGEGD